MNRCLYCYLPIEGDKIDFHTACSRKIFGQPTAPDLPYSENDLGPLALEVIRSQTAVTGVQAKLSLHIANSEKEATLKRFTVVGLWGGYILKPPSPQYPQLPEVEDLTMHLAGAAKIKTVPHSLIKLASGNLAYITKRADRKKKKKLAMEDMCQLTERLTENKYLGSHEQIGKAIQKYSATPGLDLINFFELVLFCFLTGNADMHLKNFSLLDQPGLGMVLSPAYDLVATALVNPADDEELALTLNGKKKRIRKSDFEAFSSSLKIDDKQMQNIYTKINKARPTWDQLIDISFLDNAYKHAFKNLIEERWNRLM